ncbi:hypothetical protein Lepto7375DRAFT_3280 [Leptolyngbya sp. PCC 7375]|nr:hypothetical protein Lepto7375DRAFT_3280 [Leptolyngbya sp. PCC 7375]
MSYLYYLLPTMLTFLIALFAFFRDTAASKRSILNWAFVIVAGILWPITLPFIFWKNIVSRFSVNSDVAFDFKRIHIS